MTLYALVNTQTNQIVTVEPTQSFPAHAPAQWFAVADTVRQDTHTWDPTTNAPVAKPPAPAPTAWYVLKTTIRTRLRAANLESAADAARLTMPIEEQHQWSDTILIPNDEPQITAFLTGIGAVPATILAFDPDATRYFGKR